MIGSSRKGILKLAFVGFGVLVVAASLYVKPMIASALGLAARQGCSLHFVAGMPLSLARETYIDRHVRPLGPYLVIETEEKSFSAKASLFGLLSATAVFREGYGCVLDHGEEIAALKPYPRASTQQVPINQQARSTDFHVDTLESVLEASFMEPSESIQRQTMAVLVLSKGELVAEKYAPQVRQTMPLPGFSMAKSMTATMIGLLVLHKGLDVQSVVPESGPLTEAGVTYDQLLRMTSGIGVVEDGSGRDGNSIMLTQQNDAASYAIAQPVLSVPGAKYAYTGGNAVVLARRFVAIAGDGDASDAYEFLAEKLLRPLGMNSVVLETDGVGTFLGSSFMLASALDWAKLGQLYLQNGEWQGSRLLPSNWTAYVSSKTRQSAGRDYGAGFWVSVDGGRDRQHKHLPRPPPDAYFMHGMMNQAVYILPRQELVIVRLGATRSYLSSGEWELLAGVASAWRPPE